jgi:hypothetical protein
VNTAPLGQARKDYNSRHMFGNIKHSSLLHQGESDITFCTDEKYGKQNIKPKNKIGKQNSSISHLVL